MSNHVALTMGKLGKPIARYYNFGMTFRWIRGEPHIAVKPGYVCEGQAVIVKAGIRAFEVADRPAEDPYNDRHTWIAAISVSANLWDNDEMFQDIVNRWVKNNPHLVQGV